MDINDFTDEEYIKFFDWLRSVDKIDLYEAMLDASLEAPFNCNIVSTEVNIDIKKLKDEFKSYLDE